MATPGPSRPDGADLMGWLRAMPREDLRRLVAVRPDVLRGAPLRDLAELAFRLQHVAGVAETLRRLPAPGVRVLQAATLFGSPAPVHRIAEALAPWSAEGVTHDDAVRSALAQLADCALVWPSRPGNPNALDWDAVVVSPTIRELLGGSFGLGRLAAQIAADIGAQQLQAVVQRWGLPVEKSKADLVAAVSAHLSDPGRVRRILSAAPASVARRLLAMAEQDVADVRSALLGSVAEADDGRPGSVADFREVQEAYTWAYQHGLAFSPTLGPAYAGAYGGGIEFPSEVLLALGGPIALPFDPEPPVVPLVAVDRRQVDLAAAAALADALRSAMAVLEQVHGEPVPMVKAGGVGTRSVTRLAKAVQGDAGHVRVVLELGRMLDLLTPAGGAVTTSDRFDVWRTQPPAERALDLLHAWWHLPMSASVDRDGEGRVLPVLTAQAGTVDGVVRGLVLADDPAQGAPASVPPVIARVRWHMPLARSAEVEVVAIRTEAHTWGVLAFEALSGFGARLVAGELGALRSELEAALPGVTSVARMGSDLTAVVAGSPAPELVDLLDSVADREARGAASVWRFTPASVRAAFDTGIDAENLIARLVAVCEGPLPQPLEYLVRDVARRYGHVEVRPASAVVVGADAAAVAELLASRTLRRLGLAQVADTVLTAAAAASEVVSALRAAGYLPRELDGAGSPVLRVDRRLAAPERPERRGGACPRDAGGTGGPPSGAEAAPDHTHLGAVDEGADARELDDLVERLSAGGLASEDDDSVGALLAPIGRVASSLDAGEIRQLAFALAHRQPVWIEYRNGSGSISRRVVSQLEIVGPHLLGWCHLREDQRMFRLDGVLAVAPVG